MEKLKVNNQLEMIQIDKINFIWILKMLVGSRLNKAF